MDNNWVYNASYETGSIDGLENIRRARVLAIRELKESYEAGAPDTRRYVVEVDLRFRKAITMSSGRQVFFRPEERNGAHRLEDRRHRHGALGREGARPLGGGNT